MQVGFSAIQRGYALVGAHLDLFVLSVMYPIYISLTTFLLIDRTFSVLDIEAEGTQSA